MEVEVWNVSDLSVARAANADVQITSPPEERPTSPPGHVRGPDPDRFAAAIRAVLGRVEDSLIRRSQ
jgi:hypothetical protein